MGNSANHKKKPKGKRDTGHQNDRRGGEDQVPNRDTGTPPRIRGPERQNAPETPSENHGLLITGEDRHEIISKELAEGLQDLEQVVSPENERAGLSRSEWESTIG